MQSHEDWERNGRGGSFWGHLELPMSVCLGKAKLPLSEVLALKPGSTIELDRDRGGAVDLRVSGILVARGELVVVDGAHGIMIKEVMRDGNSL
jgi:flagellar motor switch protein FliN/FliY